MSEENKSAAVHIAPEHQSSPKEHWSEPVMRLAAEEIATGKFVPDLTAREFFDYGPTQLLAQHPRVQEALERMEREKREAKNPQEALEKAQMLFEMNQTLSQPNQWDGQGRWIGKDNEAMRIGLILTPFQFLERLERAIGLGRVWVNRYAVLNRVALLAPERSVPLILLPGMTEPKKAEPVQVGTLQWPCSSEWMVMKFDAYGVPTTAKYLGWRTALLSMIQLGVVTEKEAHKAFPLGLGPAGDWYREQLQMLRNKNGTVN